MRINSTLLTRIIISLLFLILSGYEIHAQEETRKKTVDKSALNYTNEAIDHKIDSILLLLSLEEKVALCHAQSKFSSKGVPRLGIPELWMSDGPHGVRAELKWDDWTYAGWTNDSVTAFPALTCLAATFNPDLSGQYGFSLGEEARYRKKDVLLGPGVNIYRTPLNGRNFEYMGEDPFLAASLVVPYIEGIQKNGVAACVKHFALNNQEHLRHSINVEVSDRALHEIYLPAFKASVQDAGVWAVMGAYNKFRGQHACHNELLLNRILKKDWNFDGVVISDWGGTHNTREAALYGLDIEMGTVTDGLGDATPNQYDYYYLATPFLEAIRKGDIEEAVVDDKVRRILRLMHRTTLNKKRPFGSINNITHHNVALKVAHEGIVLLKNEDNFFPVEDDKNLTIAVMGDNATRPMTIGGGSSELKAQFEISPLEGIKSRFKKARILYTPGYATVESDDVPSSGLNQESLRLKAIKIAKKADIVIFIGGLNKTHFHDCESADRKAYELPYSQGELLEEIYRVNQNIGLVLISGNAVEIPWLDKVNGVLQTWYLGSMAGHAIADIISGDVNPSGKLPFTFPVKLQDNAAHYFGESSYPGDGENQYYKEDILVGYRWHETKNIKPLFAFGHGLSYTTFDLSAIKTDQKLYTQDDTIKVTLTVKNTGNLSGSEVIQVYLGKPESTVERANKELKGFQKVTIDKGESINATIHIPVISLAFYDESISAWTVEKGEYIVYVGNASDNILGEIEIVVE